MSRIARCAASPTSWKLPGTCQHRSTPSAPNWNEMFSGCSRRRLLSWIKHCMEPSQQPLRHNRIEAEVQLQIGPVQKFPLSFSVHEWFALNVQGTEFYLSVVDAIFVDG